METHTVELTTEELRTLRIAMAFHVVALAADREAAEAVAAARALIDKLAREVQ